MPRLTKRLVDALELDPGRDRFVWDSDVRGFGIRVKRSGVSGHLVQDRTGAGATRRMVVGKVGTLDPGRGPPAGARAGLRPSLTVPARAGPGNAGRDEGMVPVRSNQGI